MLNIKMRKVWKIEEENYIKNNYNEMSDKEIAEILSRTKTAVECKRKELGLLRPTRSKYTFNDVLELLDNKGYICISSKDDYKNTSSKIMYLCPNHKDKGVLETTLGHLLEGKGCTYCGRTKTINARLKLINVEDNIKLCNKNEFEYIDTKKENGKEYIYFVCTKHSNLGVQKMTYHNMKRDISGCQYCSSKNLPDWYVMNMIKEIAPQFNILSEYVNLTTKLRVYCKTHKRTLYKTPQQIIKGQGCYECGLDKLSEQHYLTNDEVVKRINNVNDNIKLISYKGTTKKSTFYCMKHKKEFNKGIHTILNNKGGCDQCYNERIREIHSLTHEEFANRLNEVHPELKLIDKYINNSTPIKVVCTKHNHEYYSTPVSMISRLTCCEKTRTTYKEEQMCKLLELWGFEIKRQYSFDDCIDKRRLLFDACLVGLNTVIEFQGEQHYRPVNFGNRINHKDDSYEKFIYNKKHDLIKKEYCKKNNIVLIEVPFWEYDDMEYYLFDQLIIKKIIQEVKNN